MKQRQHPRVGVRLPVEVRPEGWGDFVELYTKDISIGGLFIGTEDPPEVQTDVTVKLVLPDDKGVLELTGQVVHVLSVEQAKAFGRPPGIGVQFKEISPEIKRRLTEIVDAARRGETDAIQLGAGSPQSAYPKVVAAFEAQLEDLRQRKPLDVFGLVAPVDEATLRKAYLHLATQFHPQRFVKYQDAEVSRVVREIFAGLESNYHEARTAILSQPVSSGVDRDTLVEVSRSVHQQAAGGARHVRGPGRYASAAQATKLEAISAELEQTTKATAPSPADIAVQSLISTGLKSMAYKDFDAAITDLEKAVGHDPQNVDARIWLHLARARKARAAGDIETAKGHYQAILEKYDANHHEAIQMLREINSRKR